MTRSDPLAQRWLVGVELARLRRRAGMTLLEVSTATDISKPKLGHFESGRYHQNSDDIARIARACGASDAEADRLVALSQQSDGKTWWAPWSHVVASWFKTYLGLEGFAESIFAFEPIVMPGLLQTADYAEAITRASIVVRPDYVARLVELRRARASRLEGDSPLQVHAVIGEPALRLHAGTPEVRMAQMRHLTDLAEHPNVTIQVLSLENGPYAALSAGKFDLFRFAHADPIAYTEQLDDAKYVHDLDKIGTYNVVVEDLQRLAYTPSASLDLIREAID
ncbi:MAG: helix-turn-helix domain-containing protein [Stackebrandtia sp.]